MSLPSRCIDLTPAQVVRSLRKKELMATLLNHMADIAKSGEGAPKILVPIARIATSDCAWFDGGILRVTVGGNEDITRVVIDVRRGGAWEKLFPKLLLMVPFSEFARAVKLAPKLVHPLTSKTERTGLVLTSADDGEMKEPIPFQVAEAAIRKSIPTPLRLSLPPIAKAPDLKVDMPAFGEASLLRGAALKGPALPKFDEELDAGWDAAGWNDEPPVPSKRASKTPARASKAPPKASKAPPAKASKAPPPKASKTPPKASKAPPAKAPSPTAKTPAKPSKAPPAPAPSPFKPPPRPGPINVPRPGARRSIPPTKR